MGCTPSQQGPEAVVDIPEVEVNSLDRFSKVEASIAPLYRLKVDIFEGRVKRYVFNKPSISFSQLRFSFKNDQKFA